MSMNNLPIIDVQWLDSGMHLDNGWASKEVHVQQASLDRMQSRTVGMLVYEDDDIILVALNHDAVHDTYLGLQVIAKSAVLMRDEPI